MGGSIELFTSHWRSPLLADADAQMVSISRGRPRWSLPFRYRRLDALAPGDEAWAEKDAGRFEAAYIRQLEELGVDRIVADVERVAAGRAACLLCWEKPGEFCHRRSLAKFLEREAEIHIPELGVGMLPLRPDVPQPSLLDQTKEGT